LRPETNDCESVCESAGAPGHCEMFFESVFKSLYIDLSQEKCSNSPAKIAMNPKKTNAQKGMHCMLQ
jgi:hypothetical protein